MGVILFLSEIIDLVKVESGQFEMDLDELTSEKYKLLLERKVLPIVGKYLPYTEDATIIVSGSPYVYTTALNINIPAWLAHVIPVGNVSASNIVLTGQLKANPLGDISRPTMIWKYENPKLYLEYVGDFLVTEVFKAKLTEIEPTEDYTLDLFKEEAIPHMINLLLGHVMVAIGRSRRSAKFVEFPIELDSDTLVSEGNEIILSTTDLIKADADFFLALGD